jgi:hypothetical protein
MVHKKDVIGGAIATKQSKNNGFLAEASRQEKSY